MNKDNKESYLRLNKYLLIAIFLFLVSVSFVEAETCGGIYSSYNSASATKLADYGMYTAFIPGCSDCKYTMYDNIMNTLAPSTFNSLSMTTIFDEYYPKSGNYNYYVTPSPVTSGGLWYITPDATLSGGIKSNYSYSAVVLGGAYLYGSIGGVQLDLNSHGEGYFDWWLFVRHWVDGHTVSYGAAQFYTLYSYGVNKLDTIMLNANSNLDISSPLTSVPNGNALWTGGSGDIAPVSRSISSNYGVYYLAVVGGYQDQNGFCRYDDYELGVTVWGSNYLISPRLLRNPQDIRTTFSTAGKLSMLDSQPVMCNLVGEHITAKGLAGSPTASVICCGARASNEGKTNLQYICRRNAATDKYYWENACDLPTIPSGQAMYCSCTDISTGRCNGNVFVHCDGTDTYTCSGKSQDTCNSLPGCSWRYPCPRGAAQKGLDANNNIFDSSGVESFGGMSPLSSFIVTDCVQGSGSCGSATYSTTQSCAGLGIADCKLASCNMLDSAGSTHNSGYYSCTNYDQGDCLSRLGCSWTCRGDIGDTCSVNKDCRLDTKLQCDLGFDGGTTRYCHLTDTSCVVGSTGEEVALGNSKCVDGEYKICGSTNIPYNDNYCSAAVGYKCVGTPYTQNCTGTPSCFQFSQSTCNSGAYTGCGWAINGYCTGTYKVSQCEPCTAIVDDTPTSPKSGLVKGLDVNTGLNSSSVESFGATSSLKDFSATSRQDCTQPNICNIKCASTDCNPIVGTCFRMPARCEGNIRCGSYTTSTCPTACDIFPLMSSCDGTSIGSCSSGKYGATGCVDKCTAPVFGSAVPVDTFNIINNTVNRDACKCSGADKDIVACYSDSDGDGYASNSGSINKCDSTKTNVEFTRADHGIFIKYICSPSSFDCNDVNQSIRPGATEINNSVDDNCNGRIDEGWCIFGSQCLSNEFCVGGICSTTCDATFTAAGFEDPGLLCSPGGSPDSYKAHGICTQGSTGVGVCDASEAVRDAGATTTKFYSSCSLPGMNELECDTDSLSGGFSSNGVCNVTGKCAPYIPYNVRTTFDESPTFNVPSNGVIKRVCEGSVCTGVSIARPTKVYPSLVKVGTNTLPVYNDFNSLRQFCIEKGYTNPTASVSGSVNTLNGNCAQWDSAQSQWVSVGCTYYFAVSCAEPMSVAYNVKIAGIGQYDCNVTSDGLCPNDFVDPTTPICAVNYTTGVSTDSDCGNHTFVSCLPIINIAGQLAGNTCDQQNATKIITDSWCEIQRTLTNASKMHTQCVGGAVVQDSVTKCPVCLMPGEQMVYNTGVVKYVPSKADPVGQVYENMTLVTRATAYAGTYPVCPKDYTFDGLAFVCKARPSTCDQGYRTTVANNLANKCNQPLLFNSTTGRWQLNSLCLYKNAANQYTTYCGLNSWYNNYEIYDNTFKILVI